MSSSNFMFVRIHSFTFIHRVSIQLYLFMHSFIHIHSQSQGSVERTIGEVNDRSATWPADHTNRD